ncbi:hypothetical protein CEUSTIGMA_g12094.t1 [Chlamydomonas eustigma]|uniref:Chloride channel protein n=1 Tax=Chlamydomonas eustigma TaxID=1157962 RepID=A0A250XNV2_9CHLO|nr:hypothetical protein CEUSTIGMA_g12094.t1 [Chlamydomonas eustigma]|eukprot:GAX84673.1 hypothetical protein CEUSTIGMA_g12094.t1 [Chlamydomonas eustigma]
MYFVGSGVLANDVFASCLIKGYRHPMSKTGKDVEDYEIKGIGEGCWAQIAEWWNRIHIPLPYIPKLYTFLKWSFLVIIAVCTALVGFFQSFLVSTVYMLRAKYFIFRVVNDDLDWRWRILEYAGINAILAFLCTFTLYVISPAASGSGIPDVKAFLNGVESPAFKQFFTVKTFIAKVLASALGVSSGMAMGKEGPMLHAGSILAVIMGGNKWMQQQMESLSHWGVYTYNKELRDLVAIGAACGVTTAFKSPVGGVMFAMEISTRWRKDLTTRCFLACAITIVVVQAAILICNGYGECYELKYGSLIFFNQQYPAHFEQIWAAAILAVIGGYVSCLFTSFNTWICLVRKKWSKIMWARMLEVVCISIGTSIVFYILPTIGSCRPCTNQYIGMGNCIMGSGTEFQTFNGYHCSHLYNSSNYYNDMAVLVFNPQGFKLQALFTAPSNYRENDSSATHSFTIASLLVYGGMYWFLAAVTYGAFIPSGLFTPSLILGGCLGRAFAEILILMGVPNVDVGMYALLGAGAFMGGLMRMVSAMAMILMEMTTSPQQLPFLMMVLVIAKQVGDHFNYGVFEHQMMLKGLQFVGIDDMGSDKIKKEKISARDVMSKNMRSKTLYCLESGAVLETALEVNKNLGAFPVTTVPEDESNSASGDFLGLISRANVMTLLEQYGRESDCIDLTQKVEIAPVTIPPNMPLPFIYRIVQGEGFNYVPVVRYHGCLEGVVSREELVDIQNQKLDDFHLKDQIDRMNADLEAGQILGSMHLGDNIHAARFKEGMRDITQGMLNIMKNPVKATKDFLEEEGDKDEDQKEFFLTEAHGKSVFVQPAGNRHTGIPPAVESAASKAFIPTAEHQSEASPLLLEINPGAVAEVPLSQAPASNEMTPLLSRADQRLQSSNHDVHNVDRNK